MSVDHSQSTTDKVPMPLLHAGEPQSDIDDIATVINFNPVSREGNGGLAP